jgi:hypothetical protein
MEIERWLATREKFDRERLIGKEFIVARLQRGQRVENATTKTSFLVEGGAIDGSRLKKLLVR